jgi:hypothetical protein
VCSSDLGDAHNAWVGTRALWNQHTYHVTNVCDGVDSACAPGSRYGEIPREERANWTVPWLGNFRQNVQERGLFNAPDAVVSVAAGCAATGSGFDVTASVRNVGQAPMPPGVSARVVERRGAVDTELWLGVTTRWLYPGQTQTFAFTQLAGSDSATLVGQVLTPPNSPVRECRTDNNESSPAQPVCLQ